MEQGMLVIADRGFYGFELWAALMATGADLLFRVPANLSLSPARILDDGSYLSDICAKRMREVTWSRPLSAVEDPRMATHIPVRVVEYTVTGSEGDDPRPFRVITTVLDPADLTARKSPRHTTSAGSSRDPSKK
jgi:hypothetical protein